MKQSRFSEEQVVRILAKADQGEKTITELCREQGISQATYYNWRRRFRGMGLAEVREYRKLKRENARLGIIVPSGGKREIDKGVQRLYSAS